MYLLDTNVISEICSPEPSERVLAWLDGALDVYLPAPVVAELQYGADSVKIPARRISLNAALDSIVENYQGYIIPWETETARVWGHLQFSEAARRQPQALWDSLIEAMAVLHGATIATRNTSDFRHARTFNPWTNELNDPAQAGHS